jgi:hypothetical protein
MRTIDADKLVDMLYDNEFAVLCPLDEVSGVVDACPTVDAVPVVHGRWSDAGFGELPKHAPYGWACSVCGGISFNNEYIYCPNCGAKMDGERKDGGDG